MPEGKLVCNTCGECAIFNDELQLAEMTWKDWFDLQIEKPEQYAAIDKLQNRIKIKYYLDKPTSSQNETTNTPSPL